jgi:hypothetical protein
MAGHSPAKTKLTSHGVLQGWRQIAAFLGEPVSVVQRWEKEGMPVQRRRRNKNIHETPAMGGDWLPLVAHLECKPGSEETGV